MDQSQLMRSSGDREVQSLRAPSRCPRRWLAWVLTAALVFVVLALAVIWNFPPMIRFDGGVSAAPYRAAVEHPGWQAAMYAVTWTANSTTIAPIAALAALLLIWRGSWRQACFVVVAMLATAAVRLLLLDTIDRPRPVDQLAPSASWSFPSGHTTASASAALVAVIVCWPLLSARWSRFALVGLAGVWAFAVGLSRVALVVHWPTDVVGAWLLVITIVPTVAVLLRAVLGPGVAPDVPANDVSQR